MATALLVGAASAGPSHQRPSIAARSVQSALAEPSSTAVGPAASATVATAKGTRLAVFDRIDAPSPARVLEPPIDGAPIALLVSESSGGWVKAYLPERPNGTTGWVRASDVDLASDPFRVTIDRPAHRVRVTNGGDTVLDTSIAVGAALTPTPSGTYFLTQLLKAPDPNGPYGPYAYGISGYSTTLSQFDGGDAVIGIHGTNEPASLGHDASHGCIRMANAEIEKLVPLLPLGTPVVIE